LFVGQITAITSLIFCFPISRAATSLRHTSPRFVRKRNKTKKNQNLKTCYVLGAVSHQSSAHHQRQGIDKFVFSAKMEFVSIYQQNRERLWMDLEFTTALWRRTKRGSTSSAWTRQQHSSFFSFFFNCILCVFLQEGKAIGKAAAGQPFEVTVSGPSGKLHTTLKDNGDG
jgi:hypothetical protein